MQLKAKEYLSFKQMEDTTREKQIISFIEKRIDDTAVQDDIEHIIDYLVWSTHKIGIAQTYKQTLEKAEKWMQTQIKKWNNIEEKSEDIEVIKDFDDWFKIVKLVWKNAFDREWFLMRHCVASYYNSDTTIYSLRDKDNIPHATLEEWQQIKGKGNGSINPRYVHYIVSFLEEIWMTVWENEMKNLWYYKLDKIDEDLTCDELYNWYVYEDNLDRIKDKDWNKYEWFWLLNIKSLFDFDLNMKVKFNFNISKLTNYFKRSIKNDKGLKSAEDYAKVSAEDYAKVSAEDYAKVSAEDYATVSAGYYAKVSAEDYAKVSAGNYAKVSAGYSAKVSAGNYAKVSAGNYAKVSAGYSAKVSAEDYAKVSAGKQSIVSVCREWELTSNWENTLLVWRKDTKARGKIWTWLVLCEEDANYGITNVQTIRVDWKVIKEDVFYILQDWEFIKCD